MARGLGDSLSIVLGYLPVAVSFGLGAVQVGLPPLTAVLVSVIVYAGASQFALISLFAAGGSLWTVVGTTLLMNLRHLFYGPALLAKFERTGTAWPAPVLAFGLTDEVFAAAMAKLPGIAKEQREGWYAGVALAAYASWVGGTAVGAYAGQELTAQSPFLRDALSFVLPALFLALLLEMGVGERVRVLLASAVVTVALLLVAPGSWAMIGGMAAAALVGALAEGNRHGHR